jgi:hypothetical protein
MPVLKYMTGEEIHKGDRIRFHGATGEVEFIATPTQAIRSWIGTCKSTAVE